MPSLVSSTSETHLCGCSHMHTIYTGLTSMWKILMDHTCMPNPVGDYFSTAWDVIIPLVTLLFAAVIYLQQRFGGRCFMPKRLQEPEGYEKVPVASDHA
ncbi:hypothetical protein OIU84_004416 [Salix udensis]|uniref:RING-type E3 ubiquitin transferase n=1 Tax=Salix udensis TaxID=889485 RepID=A0AAD6K289_9ROSI|nr:hypothetical protein OIU84_004416 [Salix udensis]